MRASTDVSLSVNNNNNNNNNNLSVLPSLVRRTALSFNSTFSELVCCLFSWRYNPLGLYFPQPGSGL
jgi:hypothetical protein